MTPSPETSPPQLGHTITSAPLGTGWAKTLAFCTAWSISSGVMSAVALTLAWPAPFPAIDIAAALRLLGKSTMAKTSVSPKAKIKSL